MYLKLFTGTPEILLDVEEIHFESLQLKGGVGRKPFRNIYTCSKKLCRFGE